MVVRTERDDLALYSYTGRYWWAAVRQQMKGEYLKC